MTRSCKPIDPLPSNIIPLHRGVRPIDLRIVDPEFDHYSSADPDQAYADALLDEIGEGVVWLAWGGIVALFVVLWCVS